MATNGQVAITEDEAALYDRQLRLWGLEAQQRMRNATILVIGLKGVATEAIKNIVLAGIGRLVVLDPATLAGEDLGAGFFYAEDEIGQKRVDAAKPRIQSLNPLVQVDVISDDSTFLDDSKLDALVQSVDLVIVTDSDLSTMLRVNELTRRHSKAFYSGGSYGLSGYIFIDLLDHEYATAERLPPGSTDTPKTVRASIKYNTFNDALTYSWAGLRKKLTKDAQPGIIFTIFALWEYQRLHGQLPDSETAVDELRTLANTKLKEAKVLRDVMSTVPEERLLSAATTAQHEFSPVCAVLGGLLAQDVLKALGRREAPLDNFFVFNGVTGAGSTLCMRNVAK